jgi:putative endonuclease
MFFVYFLKCRDDTLYCGYTNALMKRVEAHNKGKGAKYTLKRRPVKLVYYETFETKSEAMKREYALKQLSRSEKENIISKRKTA